jgi:hypothetical protein
VPADPSLTILHTRSSYMLHTQVHRLPTPRASHLRQVMDTIQAEHGIVEACRPLLRPLCMAEAQIRRSATRLDHLVGLWKDAVSNLQVLRDSGPDRESSKRSSDVGLYCDDTYALAFSLALRISSICQNTPSPVCPTDRWKTTREAGINLIQASAVLLAHFNRLFSTHDALPAPPALPILPSHLSTTVGLCIVTSYKTIAYLSSTTPDALYLVEQSSLSQAARHLSRLGGPPVRLLDIAPGTQEPHTNPFGPGSDLFTDDSFLFNQGLFPDGLLEQYLGWGVDYTTPV